MGAHLWFHLDPRPFCRLLEMKARSTFKPNPSRATLSKSGLEPIWMHPTNQQTVQPSRNRLLKCAILDLPASQPSQQASCHNSGYRDSHQHSSPGHEHNIPTQNYSTSQHDSANISKKNHYRGRDFDANWCIFTHRNLYLDSCIFWKMPLSR